MNTIDQNKKTLNPNNKNNKKDSIIIPLELKNQNFPSYLSISNDEENYLNIDLNQDINEITEEISKKHQLLQEKLNLIEKYENLINNQIKQKNEIEQKIIETENEILKESSKIENQKAKIEELNTTIININSYLENPEKKNQIESEFLTLKFTNITYPEIYIIKSLQKDLIDYQEYIEEIISHKKPIIQELLKELQNTVDEINTNYKVNLYGSYCTGLCLPWSDMDTVISFTPGLQEEHFLNKLFLKLISKPWVKSYKFIGNTNIPIIKLVSNDKFNFHIDISVQDDNHFGLKTVELIKSYLNTYSVLKPIILALKTLLNNGKLNNPYTGGLSSYGLVLMVVSFIQSKIDTQKFNSNSPNILGETFLNVLGHYGIFFDYNKFIIITYPVYPIKDEQNDKDYGYHLGSNSHELIIIDPLNKQNNVAKSTFQYMNIKMAFMIAYMVAKEDCECGCHYSIIKNKHLSTEHCILKRIFNSVKRFSDVNKQSF